MPYNRMELRPEMVIALEPGVYFDSRGSGWNTQCL